MAIAIGVLFAFAALIFWGFGDFLIQRSTRKFGDWETLFLITAFGTLILTPFVRNDLAQIFLSIDALKLLLFVSGMMLVTALFDFEALKRGKIAVIEPVMAIEVPIAAILAFVVLNEAITAMQAVIIAVLLVGLILVSLRAHHLTKRIWLEHGVILAIIGSIFMGASNFIVGLASRITNPLVTNWFLSMIIAVVSFLYLLWKNRIKQLFQDIKKYPKFILTMSTFDNLAWVAFAFSMTLIPIAIAVAISESYIALAALLGLLVNRERLMAHQKVGLVLSLAGALTLAAITG